MTSTNNHIHQLANFLKFYLQKSNLTPSINDKVDALEKEISFKHKTLKSLKKNDELENEETLKSLSKEILLLNTQKDLQINTFLNTTFVETFNQKFPILKIDLITLWTEFKDFFIEALKNEVQKNEKLQANNDYKIYLALELCSLLTRLIESFKNFNLALAYPFLAKELMQLEETFCMLFNELDKVNYIPLSLLAGQQHQQLLKTMSKKQYWSEMSVEEYAFYNRSREFSFKDNFFKKTFSKIDEINFYKNYLSIVRNQYTHNPNVAIELNLKSTRNLVNYFLSNQQQTKLIPQTNTNTLSIKFALIMISLYLFLVSVEMLNLNLNEMKTYF